MVKFLYKHGDNRYKSPFTGFEYVFIAGTTTDMKDPRDIKLLRTVDAFVEVKKPEIILPQEIETIKAVQVGKVAPKPRRKY